MLPPILRPQIIARRESRAKIPALESHTKRNCELKILIRDGDWWLGEQLAASLGDDGHVTTMVPYSAELGHYEATDELVAGHDAVVILGYNNGPSDESDPSKIIDRSTRQHYNLLHAASEAGVQRCVYVSSLQLFDDYEENLTVTEKWRSLPPTDDVPLLACHLGEIVAKEFARDRLIQVATVRLGFPIIQGDRAAAEASSETAAVSADDAIAAIKEALTSDSLAQWQDIHIQSRVANQRYLMHAAQDLLGIEG